MKGLFATLAAICMALGATAQQKPLLTPNSIATYSLCLAAGFSDGANDCVIAGKFGNHAFWGINGWRNKYRYGWWRREVFTFTTDGYHLTKMVTPTLYAAALAIHLHQQQNWKRLAARGLISLLAFRVGHELAYQVVFRK